MGSWLTKSATITITYEQRKLLALAKNYVEKNGVMGINDFYKDQMESWKKVTLNFAITGDSGAGKSSFINAMRGLKDHYKDAAEVGEVETTIEPTMYPHPNNENIKLWDLPGIGTDTHPNLKTYSNNIGGLGKYDTFLIFSKSRFTHNDQELAEKVSKQLVKPFFFVRTHINIDLENAKRSKGPNFNEETTLDTMRQDSSKKLNGLLKDSKKDIYLIDNAVKEKHDFDRLLGDIASELPKRGREAFILSLTNVTRNCLKLKANVLRERAGLLAATTATVAVSRNPIDLTHMPIVMQEVNQYPPQFGIPDIGSKEFEELNEDCKERVLGFRPPTVKEFAIKEGAQSLDRLAAEVFEKYFPRAEQTSVLTALFCSTFKFLVARINDAEDVALHICDSATPGNDN